MYELNCFSALVRRNSNVHRKIRRRILQIFSLFLEIEIFTEKTLSIDTYIAIQLTEILTDKSFCQ